MYIRFTLLTLVFSFYFLLGLFVSPILVFAQSSSEELSILVEDNTHPKYGKGKYFTFENNQVDRIIGEWRETKQLIRNNRTGVIAPAILWRKPYGGKNSVDYRYGHGRWVNKNLGQWQRGDSAIIIKPNNVSLQVKGNNHPKYGRGKYFSYEKEIMDSIWGRTDWDDKTFYGKNSRTGKIAQIRLWRRPYGGDKILNHSIGHGRWEDKSGDWQINDIVFIYYPLK